MAYEYDRFEREDGGGSFLMGLLAGTVLGAGLGMLFAPRPGAELRTQLGDQAHKLRSTAGGAYSQVGERVTQMVDRGREAYDRARTSTESGSGNTGVSGSTGSTGSAGTSGASGSMAGSTYTGAGSTDRS
ncbi:MAG TPA: YtxH domain-containing protein [Vicinamibacterales bacterium]|nr:YtxH domain-containing protein [Vicinamibacterales bacterium]